MRTARSIVFVVYVLLLVLALPAGFQAPGHSVAAQGGWPAGAQPPARQADLQPGRAFLDELDFYNQALWHKAEGWANPLPFGNGWRADHILFAGDPDGRYDLMRIRLDDIPCPHWCSGRPYASGEYRSNAHYGYGYFAARLRAAKGSGLVNAFFVYTGPSEGNPHAEIDMEIMGRDTTGVELNYFTAAGINHRVVVPLGFDAAEDFHTYAFEWTPAAIRWYADGRLLHTEDGSRGALPSTPGRIMLSLWAAYGVDDWSGPFTYAGEPFYADFDWVRYTPPAAGFLPLLFSGPAGAERFQQRSMHDPRS